MEKEILDYDTQLTLNNRNNLVYNKNLLYWYKRLYEHQFKDISDITSKKILEIGSGTSPLIFFYKNVNTSDIMNLDYLDYVFDAHDIDNFRLIENNSLDIITMTNVLHHFKKPILFLKKASCKLKKGGAIIFTEPYFSHLSKFIYLHLHHEFTDFTIQKPELEKVTGPLSSANIALPYLIFERGWDAPLRDIYSYSKESFSYYSFISYMVTGGISRKIWIPQFLYKIFFYSDLVVSRTLPKYAASFFTLILSRK